MKYIKYNENIALAKAILRRNEIAEDNEDYLKIREMLGTDYSYVGIITRLRFIDNVTDFEELKSIYDVLKNSKMDLGKLNKMSYEQILDIFYDDLNKNTTSKEDYELIFKDETYSYFRVYTYKGILEIGSPAWCLKTKSNWDNYQAKYPEQWVVIDNRYVKKIITPNNNYLGTYVNQNKTWIRFGVSINNEDDDTISWLAHDDNDGKCSGEPSNHTFYGVLNTVINLNSGFKKSYYERFFGCEMIRTGYFKVVDGVKASNRLNTNIDLKTSTCYLIVSKSYSYPPIIVKLRDNSFPIVNVLTLNKKYLKPAEISIMGRTGLLINEYVNKSLNFSYTGIRIKLGLITLEDAKSNENLLFQIDKWLVYEWNDSYYIVVDSNPNEYILPVLDIQGKSYWQTDTKSAIFYFINKKTFKCDIDIPENDEIITKLKKIKNPGFIKKFLGF